MMCGATVSITGQHGPMIILSHILCTHPRFSTICIATPPQFFLAPLARWPLFSVVAMYLISIKKQRAKFDKNNRLN